MCFNYNFIFCLWVYNSHYGSIGINKIFFYIRLYIFQP